MQSDETISINLTGPEGSSNARLGDFVNVCGTLRSTLRHMARCAGVAETEFEITELEMGSARLVSMPTSQIGQAIVDLTVSTVRKLELGEPVDPRVDFLALYSLRGLAAPIRKDDGVKLAFGGIRLTSSYIKHIDELVAPESPSLGSASGKLKELSIHGTASFVLFPPLRGEEIECKFKEDDLQKVLLAVGKQVTVYGTLYYAKSKRLPVRVEVESFDAEPDNSELPDLLSACGILSKSQPEGQKGAIAFDEW